MLFAADWQTLFRWRDMQHLVALNSNLIVRSICFIGVYIGFTALASGYGDVELAVSSIMMQLFMVFSYFVDGFAYAAEALVGRFFGENAPLQVHRTVRCVFVWGAIIAVFFTILFLVASNLMVRIFTSDAEVLLCAHKYYGWLLVMPVLSCIAFIWDGVLVGATEGSALRNVMIGALVSFAVTYLALYSFIGIQALYAAYMAHLLFRSAYLTYFWYHHQPPSN